MSARLRLELEPEKLQEEFDKNLKTGGCFVKGVRGVAANASCEVELVRAERGETMKLAARVVFVDDTGVGVAFDDFGPKLREEIASFVNDDRQGAGPGLARNVHERMRHLNHAQQQRVAREGEAQERIVLERLYGKAVWPILVANPRLTVPEVARLARMGMMPRPQLETIVANNTWLQSPQVRRALLSNPRLTGDMALKVLRLTPKHELKLVPKQTAYPQAVRAAAKRLLGT